VVVLVRPRRIDRQMGRGAQSRDAWAGMGSKRVRQYLQITSSGARANCFAHIARRSAPKTLDPRVSEGSGNLSLCSSLAGSPPAMAAIADSSAKCAKNVLLSSKLGSKELSR